MNDGDVLRWSRSRFVKEGDILFSYMIHNFVEMIDGDSKIKHFDINSGVFVLSEYIDDIKEKYSNDIQCKLITWIKSELYDKGLFHKENWRPFRDQDLLLYMFLGYKKLFQYKQYLFQLSLETNCECDTCEYCEKEVNRIHFSIALYGWKDECSTQLKPINLFTISKDMIIPESFWTRVI